jgi:hypothetical protein
LQVNLTFKTLANLPRTHIYMLSATGSIASNYMSTRSIVELKDVL